MTLVWDLRNAVLMTPAFRFPFFSNRLKRVGSQGGGAWLPLVALSLLACPGCGDDPAAAAAGGQAGYAGNSGAGGGGASSGGSGGGSASGGSSGSASGGSSGSAGAGGTPSSCSLPSKSADAVDVTTFGAKGDGKADDTKAIRDAVASLAKGGTVYLPDGTYLVTPTGCGGTGIQLKSDMTFLMSKGATLKSKPVDCGNYGVLTLSEVQNVVVAGGTVRGERAEHLGSGGEWGHGVNLQKVTNVSIIGLTAKECWGDGIYVGPKGGQSNVSKDVTICGVVADHNRRCAIAVTSASGVEIIDTTMSGSDGTLPKSGFCGEPNPPDGLVENVVLRKSRMIDNHEAGGYFGGPIPSITRNNLVEDCVITGNHVHGFKLSGNVGLSGTNGLSGQGFTIKNSLIENNGTAEPDPTKRKGLILWNSPGAVVTGNTIKNNRGRGLAFQAAVDSKVTANIFDSNDDAAIYFRWGSKNNSVTGNSCIGTNADIDGDGSSSQTGNKVESNTGCTLEAKNL